MMTVHKSSDLTSEIHYRNEEEEYRYHEDASMPARPLGECWIIRSEILCLKPCKTSDDSDKDHEKDRWFWNSEYHWFRHFRKSFFEHFERGKEDDEKSEPLDGWIFFKLLCDKIRSDDHKDNRNHESDHEIDDIPMTRSGNREDIIEGHSDISNNNSFDGCRKSCSSSSSLVMCFVSSDFSIELPYDIEEEDCTEEFETWNLEEKYDSERKNYSQYGGTCHSPEYCLLFESWWKIFRCHTDEDRIVSTHDEVDEDDRRESFEHTEIFKIDLSYEKSEKCNFLTGRWEKW